MTTTDTDRVAVVTGGGSGLGREFVRALSAAGFRVVALGRRLDAVTETIATLDPSRSLALSADVTDEVEVEAAFAAVVRRFGRLDVLVNNAGVFGPQGEIDETEFADLRATWEVNLGGAVLCARAAWRLMRAQSPPGGRIINNGSVSAHVPRPWATAYTVSKHAITGLTKALALDGRAHGIAVGQLDIGNAATTMTGEMSTGARQADGSVRAEPLFDAADAARALVLMASLPPAANVLSLTVTASAMPLVGRG